MASQTAAAPDKSTEAAEALIKPEPDKYRKSRSYSPPVKSAGVAGNQVSAPKGWLLSTVLNYRSAVETDKSQVVVAWLQPGSSNSARRRAAGELWQLQPQVRKLTGFPSFVPTAPSCQHQIQLERTGPTSITLDISAHCKALQLAARTPTRSIQVLAPAAASPPLMSLQLASPIEGSRVHLQTNSTDTDGDGLDDVSLSLSIKGKKSEPTTRLRFRWLTRAAGASRNFSEPANSLSRVGRSALASAKTPGTARKLGLAPERARRLYAFACAEGGTPRLFNADGEPFACPKMAHGLRLLVEAEVLAALAYSRPDLAISRLGRADWFNLGSATEAEKLKQQLTRKILKRTKTLTPRRESLSLTVLQPGPTPQYGPLSFDAKGSLRVQSTDGLMSVHNGRVTDVSEELEPWPLVPTGTQSQQVAGIVFPCDSEQVLVEARFTDGLRKPIIKTELLAPRPGACAQNSKFYLPRLRLVNWVAEQPLMQLGPLLLGHKPSSLAKSQPGGPLSPNGKHRVASTELGLLVLSGEPGTKGAAQVLWRVEGATPTFCTVTNSGAQLACLQDTKALLLASE